MTEQRRKDAFEYIEGQLNNGYIDLCCYDQDELAIVKEAIKILKSIDAFCDIGCTSFMLTPKEIEELVDLNSISWDDPIWDIYMNACVNEMSKWECKYVNTEK